jgi:hypothetical protein
VFCLSHKEMAEIESGDILKIIGKINPKYVDREGKPNPVWQHSLVYDSVSTTLEPLYFWILDFVESTGFKVEKVIDNFVATPGSGYFGELGARATRMQEEGMKILGSVNTVIKSIINIIYDLKEFEIRLKHYDATKSEKKEEKEAGILALKQIWMDNVDIKRGRGSINALSYELGFTTLRDTFMAAKSPEDVEKMDLNERVKRILKPRIAEFLEWFKRSETELRKRYEIERSYLKSQVNALKLYTRWAKPYLKAAEQLRMKETTSAHLISAFNTMVFELALFCKKKVNIKDAAYNKEIPFKFVNFKPRRDYYACVFIDFTFRGIPQRISQRGDYAFGGRAEINLNAFALNDDELLMLQDELEKSDILDALRLVEATTTESLEQLQEDIDKFLKKEPSEEEKKRNAVDKAAENPFTALFSFAFKQAQAKSGKTPTKQDSKEKIGKFKKQGIPKDSHAESVIRAYAESQAADACYKVYDIFKKSHGMASFPGYEVSEYFILKGEKKF